MARGAKTETFGNEAVRLDDIFVAQPISRMRHLQLSYTHKSAVAPEERKRKGKRNKLHVEGFAPQLADKDIRSQIEEGGEWDEELTYRDFVRLICLKDKIKGKKKQRFIVDAHHLELGPDNTTLEDRFDTLDWSDEDCKPLKVIRFIGNSLDLRETAIKLEENYKLALPISTLAVLKFETE